jgi:hypothetical protein
VVHEQDRIVCILQRKRGVATPAIFSSHPPKSRFSVAFTRLFWRSAALTAGIALFMGVAKTEEAIEQAKKKPPRTWVQRGLFSRSNLKVAARQNDATENRPERTDVVRPSCSMEQRHEKANIEGDRLAAGLRRVSGGGSRCGQV